EKFAAHDICLKIHGKRSLHTSFKFGEEWRRYLFRELIGSADRVMSIVNTLDAAPELGLLMPQHWTGSVANMDIGPNYDQMQKILNKIGVDLVANQPINFPSGSMFWFRTSALAKAAELGFDWCEFGRAGEHKDGELEHAMERCFLFF